MVAFNEREDGHVDLLQIKYTKALGVKEGVRWANESWGTSTAKFLCTLGVWNLMDKLQDGKTEQEEKEMICKLQQEHVAKFLLCRAFHSSLERDGVIVEFTK